MSEKCAVFTGVFKDLSAFNVFHGVAHALTHGVSAALSYGNVAREASMASQLKFCADGNGNVYCCVGVVPIVGVNVAVFVRSRFGACAVNGICAAQDNGSAVDGQTAVCVLQIGAHGIEHPCAVGIVNDF